MVKKIVIDARLYGLEHAGIGRYTKNLVDGLIKADKDNQYAILLRKKYFNLLDLPKNYKKVLADFRHYSFGEQIRLPLILYKEKPDVVHFPHFNLPILYFGKFVVTIHDLLMHKFRSGAVTTLPKPLYLFRRVGYNLSFVKAVRASDRILVPTNAVKNDLLNHYKVNENKVVVTYEGFEVEDISVDGGSMIHKRYDLEKNNYFFYVGNAYPHKNLEGTMRALKELNKDRKEYAFAVAGSRDVFKERVKIMARNLGISKYVKILGFVPDRDLASLYKNSIAFVYSSFEEGFGLQGLEVFYYGSLLLASDIPVFREVYGGNAIYFDPYNVVDIASAMKKAIELKSKKREQIIKRAKNHLKKYSWEKMVKQTLEIYDEL